ncbi:MAG: hypothetical protein HRF45_07520 [Fimbriimonadia bacterium]|jgi:hypothetical protein
MRTAALVIAAMAAVTVHGDRLFDIPTGSIAQRGTLRMDFFAATSDLDLNRQRLQVTATKNVELTVSREALPGIHTRESLDFHYNYVPPITERFPGISVGVLDVLGHTKAGRAPYLAFSYSLPMMNAAAWEKDFLLHFGFGSGAIGGVFAGFEFPLTNNFTLWGEHDSRRINAGAQWTPSRGLGIRLFMSDSRAWFGLGFIHTFGRTGIPADDIEP